MNKKLIIFASTLFIASSLVACDAGNEKPLVDDDNNYTTVEDNNGPNNGAGITRNDVGTNWDDDGYSYLGQNTQDNFENGNIMNGSTTANENVASRLMQDEDRIERRISNLAGVRNCVVMLDKNTAYCGVDYENDNNATAINSLRQKISNEVKSLYPNIDTVFVTNDRTSYDRMKGYLNNNGINDRSTQFSNSIKNLFR